MPKWLENKSEKQRLNYFIKHPGSKYNPNQKLKQSKIKIKNQKITSTKAKERKQHRLKITRLRTSIIALNNSNDKTLKTSLNESIIKLTKILYKTHTNTLKAMRREYHKNGIGKKFPLLMYEINDIIDDRNLNLIDRKEKIFIKRNKGRREQLLKGMNNDRGRHFSKIHNRLLKQEARRRMKKVTNPKQVYTILKETNRVINGNVLVMDSLLNEMKKSIGENTPLYKLMKNKIIKMKTKQTKDMAMNKWRMSILARNIHYIDNDIVLKSLRKTIETKSELITRLKNALTTKPPNPKTIARLKQKLAMIDRKKKKKINMKIAHPKGKPLGSGFGRTVYNHNKKYIIKVAHNGNGIMQNRADKIHIKGLTLGVIKHGNDFIIQRKVKVKTKKTIEFYKDIMEVFLSLDINLSNWNKNRHNKILKDQLKIISKKYGMDVTKLSEIKDLAIDFTPDNIGELPNGDLRIIDNGFLLGKQLFTFGSEKDIEFFDKIERYKKQEGLNK